VEGILDFRMENVGQFIGEPAARRLVDEGLDGGDERAVTGKPNSIMGPQADVVESGGFAEGIVTAAVRIAGEESRSLSFRKTVRLVLVPSADLSSGKVAILWRRRCLRRAWGSKESGRIML